MSNPSNNPSSAPRFGKLYALLVFRVDNADSEPILLASAYDTSSFGIFQRKAATEFITMLSRLSAKKCPPGTRTQIEKDRYTLYTHRLPPSSPESSSASLAAVLACDSDYNARVAFGCVAQILDEFRKAPHAAGKWDSTDPPQRDNAFQYDGPERLLKQYADPVQADRLLALQSEIQATKTVMHQAIQSLLERGERLDDLVERSGDLTDTSRRFYKAAAKTNSCCSLTS